MPSHPTLLSESHKFYDQASHALSWPEWPWGFGGAWIEKKELPKLEAPWLTFSSVGRLTWRHLKPKQPKPWYLRRLVALVVAWEWGPICRYRQL